jgi:phage major head subunit gpT-like protein
MDINRANMNALFTGYNMVFRDAFQTYVDTTYQQFTQEVSGNVAQIDMPLLEQLSGMRHWVGPREIKNLSSAKLTIKARSFEDTVKVMREDIEDDQYGLYNSLFQTLAMNGANMGRDIINELITGAQTAKWLDGANFFGTRRYGKGGGTIVNKSADPLTFESFNAAYDGMRQYKGHGNQPLGIKPTMLLHGPALRTTVADVIDSQIRAAAVGDSAVVLNNPNHKRVATVEVDGIIDNSWFLLDTSKPFKPIIMFMRKKADRLIRLDREEDTNVFMNKEFIYGTDGRCEAAYALPHLIHGNFVA